MPTRVWELVLQEMTKPLMSKINPFWNRSLVRRLDLQVVHLWPEDRSGCVSGTGCPPIHQSGVIWCPSQNRLSALMALICCQTGPVGNSKGQGNE